MRGVHILIAAVAGAVSSDALAQQTFELDETGQWALQETQAPTGHAAVMTEVRQRIAEGRPAIAYDIVHAWIETHEDENLPESPMAYRLRGDALTAMGKEYKALYDYEYVCRVFPQSEEMPIAVEREYDIALRYLGGLRMKFLGLRIEDATDVGVELLIRVHERMPGSEIGEQASIAVADHYFERRDMAWAVEAYDAYLRSYPQGPHRERALKRRVIGNLARYRGPQHDVTSLIDAKRQIIQLQRELPEEAEKLELDERMITMIDSAIADQTLESAKWRLKRGDDPAARFLLRKLIRTRPGTDAAAAAERMLIERGWAEAPEPEAADGGSEEGQG